MEYYLLYYSGWKFREAEDLMRPVLTYCVSLGELPYATMAEIASAGFIKHRSRTARNVRSPHLNNCANDNAILVNTDHFLPQSERQPFALS